MPKKRTFNFKQLQGSSSGGNHSQDGSQKTATVNERLAESRKIVGRDAAQKKRELAEAVSQRPSDLMRFAQLTGTGPGGSGERPGGLMHLALKTAAESWEMFDEEDLPALVELPLRLRLQLMSYLAFYGPNIGISVFDALTAGNEPVTYLDMAGLFGEGSLTLHRLVKYLKGASAAAAHHEVEPAVAESWEQDEALEAALSPGLPMSRFSQLTHLSLSHPPTGTSWRDLLALSKLTPNLTHLSLAYWPRPTLAPNLATTTVTSQHSLPIRAGGSHYYFGIDEDYSEPASILRQLSGNLLRLQWLDLEGCAEWLPALAYQESDEDLSRSRTNYYSDLPQTHSSAVASIFAHHWKGLKVLRCGQGWLPKGAGLRALPRQTMSHTHRELVDRYLEDLDPLGLWWIDNQAADIYDVEKRRAEIWVQRESRAHTAARTINAVRRDRACSFVHFDFGWPKRHEDGPGVAGGVA
ncbi:hypothetical protein CLAFUW4_05355 [Fulvia fulva]|uniref:Uncharacterized protein n=1 Tax=Passalora fulva TaxID=5499 RepID=A0A9Q8P8N3_PASFU|nr:uncharacterized protein CLAFUR5_05503 [Fulvia fulva]KAK4624075.1 hypothetical protein CLAFUR4_05349 [Fulvia fulva]KAK4625728.1 hypothetical protein CLAFUR0_05357 [Fulvia fulva]UJO17415.1 hypothetical protein CLAFUR5_05503 [Fulvia fulva]WPV15341.1 hypothetical protein CLAFUW4_05355 [Fulvia fulva]WPV30541.1 hypothetical protein CLAFUW7_05353 [Fulvia fulva]